MHTQLLFILLYSLFIQELPAEEPWASPVLDLQAHQEHWSQKELQGHFQEPIRKKNEDRFSILLLAIAFHQNVISPADGPRSHFLPSSSQYAKQAIQRHGVVKGFILAADRLMRENKEKWIYPVDRNTGLKLDPIPLKH